MQPKESLYWQDKSYNEIYFPIPVEAEAENAATLVEEGDLAYWPEGRCFCIFFSLTPASLAQSYNQGME